ncbi:L-rhamnonate dehydratase [Flavimaricola marinus]|uniref:L-rhamnonate dehydratase n=2 Tax=Flavimaricola marinus TaxID=1819565 RepID=A0A238LJB1_9RHOB|nr:L-rhamnonate dehydratase [Flavimaricola marinus]
MALDVDYTPRFAEAARDLQLKWIEDRVPANDIAGLIRLRTEMDPAIALALGNFAHSEADCAELGGSLSTCSQPCLTNHHYFYSPVRLSIA